VILMPYEDDDIFLPHHLSGIATVSLGPSVKQFFIPESVFSTYNCKLGDAKQEGSDGRFHSSWAYSLALWNHIGGYPTTTRLDFDQQMNGVCRREADVVSRYNSYPSYVYRWGRGPWNGSQVGESNWRKFWEELGKQYAPPIEKLNPDFDEETRMIYSKLSEYFWD
jgi:hypothetical protein